jgi:excisionase family DNA binding protein
VPVNQEKNKMLETAEQTVPSALRLLLSKPEAAWALNISLRKLDYLIAEKALGVRRIGSRVLVPRRELERYARGR